MHIQLPLNVFLLENIEELNRPCNQNLDGIYEFNKLLLNACGKVYFLFRRFYLEEH